MTKYDFLKDKLVLLKVFINIGLVSPNIYTNLKIVGFYQALGGKNKMLNYQTTADHFRLQPRQIMNILKEMQETVDLPPNSIIESFKISQI
jgi:hypothetical protein